ncbi:tRNA (guanine(46)-N(7))-methyltransferase [Lentibacillus sp. JNUCC-1]|uniref:tRNA (guanosine(46)-N7)-methyltransferase TrmB n=1 Tax=Lentibacillus sp. JNUCC-1 TaxID=2654513 RepID=UPI0012E84D2C|nr:tRNA (guanosine(46)-N7)-methyltransferase TrmB [Lentibacillus sp. JNUCC-1]MUV39275.1 tRNA (guanine(46)-N(7))-methyltransferase [Lentibacillus sp. JNUCC-1]
MRQRHKPWADDFLKEHDTIVLPNAIEHKGKWASHFGNNRPIHLEIGTGKGQFISGMAKQHPDINFIGIELAKSVIVNAAEKVIEADQKNVVLLNENAEKLTELFGESEIDTIYLNFSDPWPKNRHEKRRLTFQAFLQRYEQCLVPNGEIILKTDNGPFFEYSLVSFSQFGLVLEEVNVDLHKAEDEWNIMTEYEEKFSAKGQPIYRCRAHFNNISKG